MKFFIGFGCGCGEEYEVIEAKNEDDAMHYAHECAVENYQSFEGYHGVLDWGDVKEEYELEDDYEVDVAYQEEIESTIKYWVDPFDENNEEHVERLEAQGRAYEV